MIIALARGGFYDAGSPAAALEHLETYLRGVFNFIGIEPEFVAADGLAIGPEQRDSSISRHLARRSGSPPDSTGARLPLRRRPEPRRRSLQAPGLLFFMNATAVRALIPRKEKRHVRTQ